MQARNFHLPGPRLTPMPCYQILTSTHEYIAFVSSLCADVFIKHASGKLEVVTYSFVVYLSLILIMHTLA